MTGERPESQLPTLSDSRCPILSALFAERVGFDKLHAPSGRGHNVAPSAIRVRDHGDNHVRIALIENEERTRQALRGIKQMQAKGVLPAVSA